MKISIQARAAGITATIEVHHGLHLVESRLQKGEITQSGGCLVVCFICLFVFIVNVQIFCCYCLSV